MSVISESYSVHIVWGEDNNTGDFFWKMIHLIIGYQFMQPDGGLRVIARSNGDSDDRTQTVLVEHGAYDAVGESYYVVSHAFANHFVIRAYDTRNDAAIAFMDLAILDRQ